MSLNNYVSLPTILPCIPLHSFRLSTQMITADGNHVVIFNSDKRFELVRGDWKGNTKVGIQGKLEAVVTSILWTLP
jgi:hypothetical protein